MSDPDRRSAPDNWRDLADRNRMATEEKSHAVLRVLEGLDDESLSTIRDIFQACAVSGKAVAAWYVGLLGGLLNGRGVCHMCDKNHAEELLGGGGG